MSSNEGRAPWFTSYSDQTANLAATVYGGCGADATGQAIGARARRSVINAWLASARVAQPEA